MRCDNLFCVYWTEEGCTLDEISLDISGCCECCIYVDIDESTLRKKREEQLRRD
ncbi:MAG: hypothetical protein IKK70_00240 [Clostridia bacterium]|nr:hypothetical protein [Clostridia bacterium]